MIDLMKTGYALPVLSFIEQMAAKTDQSLIRYFVLQVIKNGGKVVICS